jgi:hypothetical protein
MERKLPVKKFQKIWFTSRGSPLLRKFRKMLFHSPLEISGNSNPNFSLNGKRLLFVLWSRNLSWVNNLINTVTSGQRGGECNAAI